MHYHVEISQISCVNLQREGINEKVQDLLSQKVWCIFMEHRKKGGPAVSLYSVVWQVTPLQSL
jgi:hypothetical protein